MARKVEYRDLEFPSGISYEKKLWVFRKRDNPDIIMVFSIRDPQFLHPRAP